MGIDKELGHIPYNESQTSSFDLLVQLCAIGVTPDFPHLAEQQPAYKFGPYYQPLFEPTTSRAQVCHIYDIIYYMQIHSFIFDIFCLYFAFVLIRMIRSVMISRIC